MESEKLLEEEEGEQQAPSLKKARTSQQSRPFMLILRWCAVFLICLFYVLVWVLAKWKATEYQSSQYGQSARMKKDDLRDLTSLIEIASLPRNLDEPYYQDTSYSDSSNTSLTAALWNAIDIDSGVIALSDDYVAAKNLPSAQRFPWDKTKGIYIVHGYHNLHCLVRFLPWFHPRITNALYRKSSTSPWPSSALESRKAGSGRTSPTASMH